MIFRQLPEPDSNTYTYLLGCSETRLAVLIDPVLDTLERDLQSLRELDLRLAFTLETHHHADHLTSARMLRQRTGCKVAYPLPEKPDCADVGVSEGTPLRVGRLKVHPLFTPGHTSHHFAYRLDEGDRTMVFTGDALLIDGCGRTDFQSGDAATLYRSVHDKLFSLPGETLVYPGHDYQGRFVSSIAQERARNPRLGKGNSQETFVAIMDSLDLPYPRKIDFAVPGNEQCGKCPDDIPEKFRAPCEGSNQG